MKYEWNQAMLTRLDIVSVALGLPIFLLGLWLLEQYQEAPWWLTILYIVAGLLMSMPKITASAPRKWNGAWAQMVDGVFYFENPNNRLKMEIPLATVTSYLVIDLPFFSYLRLNLQDKKYFSMYFFDPGPMVQILLGLGIGQQKGSLVFPRKDGERDGR